MARCPEAWALLWLRVEARCGQQGSMKTAERTLTRREPLQERSRQTVDAVLEAVQLVVKRHGTQAVTTNRIAEAAGVSVGSVYQYVPDKGAIFTALHDRHVDDVRLVIEQTTADCASAPLVEFARELVLGLVDAHTEVAELHDVVAAAVPQSALGFRNARKDGNLEATLARKKLRTTMVALASVGETDHSKLKWFAIHAWRGAMQAAQPAIEQRAGRSETAVITPAAADQSQEVRAR